MKAHEVSCSEHAAVTAEYPVEPDEYFKIQKLRTHFGGSIRTIYADFESILEQIRWRRK